MVSAAVAVLRVQVQRGGTAGLPHRLPARTFDGRGPTAHNYLMTDEDRDWRRT